MLTQRPEDGVRCPTASLSTDHFKASSFPDLELGQHPRSPGDPPSMWAYRYEHDHVQLFTQELGIRTQVLFARQVLSPTEPSAQSPKVLIHV